VSKFDSYLLFQIADALVIHSIGSRTWEAKDFIIEAKDLNKLYLEVSML
jgi:hypothetical protein